MNKRQYVETTLVGTTVYLVYEECGGFNVYREEGPEGYEYLVFITRYASHREVSEFFQWLKAEAFAASL